MWTVKLIISDLGLLSQKNTGYAVCYEACKQKTPCQYFCMGWSGNVMSPVQPPWQPLMSRWKARSRWHSPPLSSGSVQRRMWRTGSLWLVYHWTSGKKHRLYRPQSRYLRGGTKDLSFSCKRFCCALKVACIAQLVILWGKVKESAKKIFHVNSNGKYAPV